MAKKFRRYKIGPVGEYHIGVSLGIHGFSPDRDSGRAHTPVLQPMFKPFRSRKYPPRPGRAAEAKINPIDQACTN